MLLSLLFQSPFFPLGRIIIRKPVLDSICEDGEFSKEVYGALGRYCKKDWGNLSEDDCLLNENAVNNRNDRILAVYDTKEGVIYVETNFDCKATYVYFAADY